jgi:polysaccharide pyruvyl transferase WcaK-like protein
MKVGIFNDTSRDNHFGCHAVMSVLDRELKRAGLKPAFYWSVAQDWRPFAQKIRESKIDAIVVNGEGSIHHSTERARARYLSELGSFAKRELGVPSVLLNATLYALDNETLRHLADFDQIFVRESGSHDYLCSEGIKSIMVPDLSFFAVSRRAAASAEQVKGDVLVTDSVLRPVAVRLNELATKNGYRFLPMQSKNTVSKALLMRAWRRLHRRFGLLPEPRPKAMNKTIVSKKGFSDFIVTLQKSQGIVTGRFHTTTLAIAQHVPVLAIESNTPKIGVMLRDIFGSADRLVNISTLADAADLSVPPLSALEKNCIDTYLDLGEESMQKMFMSIGALVERENGKFQGAAK